MSLLQGDGWEVAEQLDVGEVAICVDCDDFCLDRADLREIEGTPVCDNCGTGGFKPGYLSRRKPDRALESRWDREVLALGWTATPDLLADNLQTLGLDESHYFLLRILESYRWKGRNPVWPSIETIMSRTPGWSRSKVERRLRELRQRKLIEAEPTRRFGHQAENRFTRHGLDAALRRIVEQHSTGDVLRIDTFLPTSPSLVTEQPVTDEGTSPSPVTGHEAEEVEADVEKAEAANAARARRAATVPDHAIEPHPFESDGAPGAALHPGAVPVEAEHVVAEVAVEPCVESPDQTGVRDAVSRAAARGLNGIAAPLRGTDGDRRVHGVDDKGPLGGDAEAQTAFEVHPVTDEPDASEPAWLDDLLRHRGRPQ